MPNAPTSEHAPSDVRLYGPLVQWLYGWTNPGDPRGVVDIHAVPDEQRPKGENGTDDDGTSEDGLWLHTHGAQAWDLPDLELVGVPEDVGRIAEDLIWALLKYARREGPIRAGEDFAGFLVGGRQETMHLGEFARAPDRDSAHDGMLRIVDPGGSLEDGCPNRLLATHICAIAENTESLEERAALFRRSIALHPGGPAGDLSVDDPGAFADLQSRTNIGSWEGLARTLAQQEKPDQLRTCLEQVVVRAPSWAREVKEQLLEKVDQSASPTAEQYADYWRDLDIDQTADATELVDAPPGGADRLEGWDLRTLEAGRDGMIGLVLLALALAGTVYLLAGGDAGSGPSWPMGVTLVGLQGWCVKEEMFPANPDAPLHDQMLTIAHWAARIGVVAFLVGVVF